MDVWVFVVGWVYVNFYEAGFVRANIAGFCSVLFPSCYLFSVGSFMWMWHMLRRDETRRDKMRDWYLVAW